MTYENFENLYDTVIREYMVELEDVDAPYHSLTFYEKRRKLVYNFYEKKRFEVREKYMKQSENLALDRHKVASCMIYAILKGKLIETDTSIPGLPEQLLLANESLAVMVALNIVEMYKIDDFEDGKNNFGGNYQIDIPYTFHDEGERSDFIPNTCKCLHFIKNLEYFDVFAYSTILFLLENRTDVILQKQHNIQQVDIGNQFS